MQRELLAPVFRDAPGANLQVPDLHVQVLTLPLCLADWRARGGLQEAILGEWAEPVTEILVLRDRRPRAGPSVATGLQPAGAWHGPDDHPYAVAAQFWDILDGSP